jgi:hypothetical protein
MNALKIALLGTAALAAVSVSARADELSNLKAQIEALNAQVAATADAPAASATVITWSGNVAAGVVYVGKSSYNVASKASAGTSVDAATGHIVAATPSAASFVAPATSMTDIRSKWGLSVKAVTDTAVGEVGVNIAFAGGDAASATNWYKGRGTVNSDGYSAWWKITPALTLKAGSMGSLSGNGQGQDDKATNIYGGQTVGGFGTPGDLSSMVLAYADGPISAAIGIEDGDNNKVGFAGEVKYSGDGFNVEVNGGSNSGNWAGSVGLGYSMDMFSMSMAAGMGSGPAANDDWSKASGLISMKLGDTMSAELGAGHTWNEGANNDVTAYNGGIYYSPVGQLKIGVEAGYKDNENSFAADVTSAALVTKFSF